MTEAGSSEMNSFRMVFKQESSVPRLKVCLGLFGSGLSGTVGSFQVWSYGAAPPPVISWLCRCRHLPLIEIRNAPLSPIPLCRSVNSVSPSRTEKPPAHFDCPQQVWSLPWRVIISHFTLRIQQVEQLFC